MGLLFDAYLKTKTSTNINSLQSALLSGTPKKFKSRRKQDQDRMSQLTSIKLPQSVPYPVTISSILCREGQTVPKRQAIFKYTYWDFQDDPQSKEEEPPQIRVERIGTFESPVEGVVEKLYVHLNEEIYHSETELCTITEACTHTVQYGGLCALCGRAVGDDKDYTGYDFQDRATISMSHDNTGLKISLEEATKLEESTTTRLSKEKKLILVVDLDQTVIHATVDPTVREWQLDPKNPNYAAVKDVERFCLEEEIVQRGGIQPSKCWYYVKIRPGLAEFLNEISKLYELHIYTMATRNYALAIAKIIDPDGNFFGDRILSRDESGSLTHKNLKRLFPVDQLMVVIIDDRGDVWQWESNLIKVVPYDFFVGIGDINSSFLPKKNGQLTGPTKKRNAIARLEQEFEDKQKDEVEAEGNTLAEQELTRSASIEQQQHDRPLAKLQHNLEKLHSHPESTDALEESEDDDNLLQDDDTELYSLNKVLLDIHTEYYKIKDLEERPDLTLIIPRLKSKCLQGVTVLFSGIIPVGANIANADIVIWCRQFGVEVVGELYPHTTHVVCRDPKTGPGLTLKTRMARRLLPKVKVVNPDWLFACLSRWSKVDEKDYLISYEDAKAWEVNQDLADEFTASFNQRSKQEKVQLDEEGNEYDLDEANQEVDDFLAGISDDEEDDEDDEVDVKPNNESFVKDLYKDVKKRSLDQGLESKKKIKLNGFHEQENLDELEQELLDVFDDMEDE